MAASLPFLFLVAWFWNRGPGLEADDYAHTILHAQALVEGRPYGDIGFITSPLEIVGGLQPPGLPVLVAMTEKVFGEDWTALKLVMALTSFPFILLSGLYFGRSNGRATGIAVMVMTTVAVGLQAPHIQPDLGFAGLVWATVFLLDRDSPVDWVQVLGVFVLVSAALALRYLGAALVPTVALFALLGRREKRLRLAVPVGVWAAAGIAIIALGGFYLITQQLSLSPARFVRRIFVLFQIYGRPAAEGHLYPLPWNRANDIYHFISLTLALIGLAAWTRTHWRTAAWLFTVSYLVVLDMVFAQTGRYLIPLYPVLIFGFLHGLGLVAKRVRPNASTPHVARLRLATGATLGLAALAVMVARVPRTGGYLAEVPEAQALFAYLREEDPTQAKRVMINQARVMTWQTGIPAMILMGTPPNLAIPEMDRVGITHVVLDRLGLAPWRTDPMLRTIATHGCRFEQVYENGVFTVYHFLPPCNQEARALPPASDDVGANPRGHPIALVGASSALF